MCRASVRAMLALAGPGKLTAAGLRSPLADRLLAGESVEERLESFHLVAPNGTRWKGPEALPVLLDLLGPLRPAATTLRRSTVARRAAAAGYWWVSRNRPALARFVPRAWARPLTPAEEQRGGYDGPPPAGG